MASAEFVDEEDPEERFVRGRGRYVDDLKLEGMLHLHVVRSPYARARVLSVSGGITGKELKATMESVGEDAGGRSRVPFPALSADRVNYVGQPVAAVLGADRYEAEDRADEVDVQYEALKPVMDPEKALQSEPIHPGMESNLVASAELGKDFRLDAPVEVEETLRMARVATNPLETRGAVVVYDGSVLTVYASSQSVFSWREGLAGALGLKADAVRVVQLDTGGAFGVKGGIYPEYVVAAYAAMKTKKPVKWVESRYEHQVASNQGRGVRGKVKLYADRKGKLMGVKADILVDSGAYPMGGGAWTPRWIASQVVGPYAVPRAYATAKGVLTNKVNMGPYRGAGRPEAAFFMERAMDRLADATGVDAAELRLRNATVRRTTSPLGTEAPPSKRFFAEALEAFDYKRRKKGEKLGLSFFMLIPAAAAGESGKVAVKGGKVLVWIGGSTTGQGHATWVRTLVARELGVPAGSIELRRSDTGAISGGVGSWGSRTAIVGGGAVVEASRKLKAMAKKKLGRRYSAAALLEGEYEAEVFFKPAALMNSLGANLATARLTEDGNALVDAVETFYDVGVPLNPAMIESQVAGGIAQAIGEVMYEQALYSEDGQMLTATIADAGLLHSTEMPRMKVMTSHHRSPLPHGAKGVGESPTIGVPPAATRALELLLGRKFTDLPIAPERLWRSGLLGEETR
ncbi:MAG: xanthine dehydrogenase family protein molybdopterin-binding subunit [Nitrososphaerota archaeon]|nr:xanthine dehydrogenase family protein molybdopterin-binding subunit [Nitrososphaerota archaeon]